MTKYTAYPSSAFKFTLLLVTLTFFSLSRAQIISGDTNVSDEKKEKKKKEPREKMNRDSLSGTTYYLTGLFNYSYRSFQDNSVYQSYSTWNDQKPDYAGGVTLGLFLPINKWLDVDLGFTYFSHKEKYDYVDPNSDSTYSYSNNYRQIGVPIKLRYTYGERFQIFGFAGVTPVNLINIRFDERYNKKDGTEITPDPQTLKEKLSIFNIMATAGIGVSYNFDWLGITLYPEFRRHLLNTYDQSKPIDHKMYGLGINLGLTLRF